MTQHEQKPESAEFRTREAQITYLGSRIFVGMRNHTDSMCEAQRHIDEAEARGAAEQRRKDAEGVERWEFQEPEYHAQGMGCGLEDRGIHDRYQAMEYGWDQAIERCIERIPEELHTRPANVAALEARVKELEDVVRGYLEASDLFDACTMICPPKALFEAKDTAMHHLRAAAIREGGEHG